MSTGIVIQLIIGLGTSVIGGFLVYGITKNPKISAAAFAGILAIVVAVFAFYRVSRAPYEVLDAQWQVSPESARITGLLVDRETQDPVRGKPIQIKIFEAGRGSPAKGPSFPTTDAAGRFVVVFDGRGLKPDTLYIINTAYKYGERWEIKDFDVATGSAATVPAEGVPPTVSIDEPLDAQVVGAKTRIRGRVSDPDYKIYVLIHPLAVGSWWVQPLTQVAADGSWVTDGYFGETTAGRGETFEILAIASRSGNLLRRGQQLQIGAIPIGAAQSSVVRVIRKQ